MKWRIVQSLVLSGSLVFVSSCGSDPGINSSDGTVVECLDLTQDSLPPEDASVSYVLCDSKDVPDSSVEVSEVEEFSGTSVPLEIEGGSSDCVVGVWSVDVSTLANAFTSMAPMGGQFTIDGEILVEFGEQSDRGDASQGTQYRQGAYAASQDIVMRATLAGSSAEVRYIFSQSQVGVYRLVGGVIHISELESSRDTTEMVRSLNGSEIRTVLPSSGETMGSVIIPTGESIDVELPFAVDESVDMVALLRCDGNRLKLSAKSSVTPVYLDPAPDAAVRR